MKNFKKHDGITLIALVITIIVMLILVAVTINFALEGDLFKLARNSSRRTKLESEREELLAAAMGEMDDGNLKFKGFKLGISEELDNWQENGKKDGKYSYISPSGNIFYIDEAGNITADEQAVGMTVTEKNKWDKDATPEEYFTWASNNPNDGDLYRTITGYNDEIINLTKIKIPTRCIVFDGEFYRNKQNYGFDCNATGYVKDWAKGKKGSNNITSVEIPNTVQKIRAAFPYFSKLKSIDLPGSIIYIGTDTFLGCDSLNKITSNGKDIAKADCNIQYIAGGAFSQTAWYNNQPNGEIYIGKVFYNYKGAVPANYTCEIKDGTISIAGSAFYNTTTGDSTGNPSSMDGLVGIKVPSSLCFIGDAAFYNRTNLETFEAKPGATLDNITFIGKYNFISTKYTTWKSKWYNNQPDGEIYIGKVFYNYKGTVPANYTCEIKDGTRTIASFAFNNATSTSNVTKVIIPNTVEIIEDCAFYYCYNITELKMSDNIIHIGAYAFSGCNKLTSITFAKDSFKECANDIVDCDVKSGTIHANAFNNCTNLKNVTFLGNRPYMSSYAFSNVRP